MKKSSILFALLLIAQVSFAEDLTPGFYNKANGLKDGQLKDTLKSLIRDHTVIPYGSGANSSWGVFYYSDRDEEGYCMDMYCDEWYKFSTPGEKVSGCNVEHSFAKSWWGGASNDAYKDCYHLNPSNSTANSARSNYPLGNVTKVEKTAGSLKIGKQHHDSLNVDFNIWEPKDEYKGDFARAYFYMATCYGHWSDGTIDQVLSSYNGWRLDNKDVGSKFAMQNDNYLEFQPWEQEVLIEWHRKDPVSIKEIRRMDAVSNFQHNRNPFIDYPYLAEYIGGDRAGEELDLSQLMASSDDEFVPGVSNGLRDGSTQTVKPKHGVSWSVNGEIIQVDSIVENKKIQTLPETPVSCSALSVEFKGWTTTPISGTTDEAPERLYATAKEVPSVAADITLYAVFARKMVYEGGEPATYTLNDDHQDGWTINANYTSYWLLDAGHTIVSPEVDLSGLSTITVQIRTYGGKDSNILNVTANGEKIADITTTTGTEVTSYSWTNTGALTGKSPLTFSTNYSSGKGIGLASAVIEATGTRVVIDRYLTECDATEDIENEHISTRRRKIMRDGQLLILVDDQIYNILGQKLQ